MVVVPIWDVDLGRYAAQTAFQLLAAGVAAVSTAATAILDGFVATVAPATFGESRIRLIEAATRRGIPWSRLVAGTDLIGFGQGARQLRLLHNCTSNTSFIAVRVTSNKHIAAQLLRDQGLPVPASRRCGRIPPRWSAMAGGRSALIAATNANRHTSNISRGGTNWNRPISLHRASCMVLADPATRAAIILLTHRSVAEDGLAFDACALALMAPLSAQPPNAPAEAVERYRTAALLRAIFDEQADPADRASIMDRVERIAIADGPAGH